MRRGITLDCVQSSPHLFKDSCRWTGELHDEAKKKKEEEQQEEKEKEPHVIFHGASSVTYVGM